LNLSAQGATRAGILSADAPAQQFALTEMGKRDQFVDYVKEGAPHIWARVKRCALTEMGKRVRCVDYVKEGVLHIWTGFDHILFLLSLLLPAVLVRSRIPGVHWTAAASFKAAFWDVFQGAT